VYPEYDFGVTYRTDIQFIPKVATWLLAEIEAESGAGVFPCGEGGFPHSCEAQGTFGFRHPQSPVPEQECLADGPGCSMFRGFHWQTSTRSV
jgi:hypothetical protein